ncbi:type II secretion system major pseudopilin GspG [Tahibacter amnicola]|uniref:Type II secretion system core protein G n=1 Tax=Tahibacter amnicola TaxID=2976241 RepID=A0ABY6BFA7_9GAMM|nr:type II secretion system major pseudopilin GspG [Tahibacter amnicola]UXI67790.1 type II secretion system major pseudopilin GspG [Tahibacter amnicola]
MKYTSQRHTLPRAAAGFSLLEMLAVIVLIGIVAGLVVNNVLGNVERGKWAAGKAQVAKIAMNVESYAMDNGSPPAKLEDLVTRPGNASGWKGPYGKESDLKDPFGKAFGYKSPGEHGDFDVVFYGKDGKQGGEGTSADHGNWQ